MSISTSVYLVVLFLVNGQPTIIDGFHPRQQESLDICEERLMVLKSYLEEYKELYPEVHKLSCETEIETKERTND
jgi:hypothetical protein